MQIYIWLAVIVFFAGFIKGLSGFASTLVALPLLTIIIDIKTVVPFANMLAVYASIFLLIRLFKHLKWKDLSPLLVGFFPGMLIGVFFLKTLNKNILQLILGSVLIFYSTYSLFFEISLLIMKKIWAYIFGFISGILRGVIGAGGPPIIIYASLQPWNKDKIKATLQGYLIISGPITIFFHACTGLVTGIVLKYFFISLPIFALGTYIGSHFYWTISEKSYKRIILILLNLLGFFIIYKTIIIQ